jgi:hypothetical protein
MKSDFVGIEEADLISSETARRRFHPSLRGFHRAKQDFINFVDRDNTLPPKTA